jgi:MFS family permease
MAVGPVVGALSGVPAGRAVDRFGSQRMSITGLVGMATGCATLPFMATSFGVAGYVPSLVVITSGYALFQAANNTAVMTNVQSDQRGVISGLLNLSRNLGIITGASAMGAVFAVASAAADITTASPEAVATGMRVTFLLSALLVVVALAVLAVSRFAGRR